jgi:bifunctional UDP-N-acetylglucosamine pyrophosphorylase/glucosamine-1-phosphate N-acetyltransferase
MRLGQRPLSAIVLAAGAGTRMRSERPKPLHRLCGRTMLQYVLDSLADVDARRAVIVVGHGGERVTKKLQEEPGELALDFVEQRVQRGTGDAVAVALSAFDDDLYAEDDDDVLVLPGDTPLLLPSTIAELVIAHQTSDAACTLLSAEVGEPYGYGRVVRDREGHVARVVEEADATIDELDIHEVNTSIYCFRRSLLAPALRRLSPENAQGEYYLTDVVSVLHDAGHPVDSVIASDADETQGVNDRNQLAAAERQLRARINSEWLRMGVTMVDPETTYVDATVRLAPDVSLFPGAILQGHTVVGEGSEIGPGCRLVDCTVGAGVVIESTTARHAEIGDHARVGPFAVLEPGTVVAAGAATGPFYTSSEGH